jgi:hypothetical protein
MVAKFPSKFGQYHHKEIVRIKHYKFDFSQHMCHHKLIAKASKDVKTVRKKFKSRLTEITENRREAVQLEIAKQNAQARKNKKTRSIYQGYSNNWVLECP